LPWVVHAARQCAIEARRLGPRALPLAAEVLAQAGEAWPRCLVLRFLWLPWTDNRAAALGRQAEGGGVVMLRPLVWVQL